MSANLTVKLGSDLVFHQGTSNTSSLNRDFDLVSILGQFITLSSVLCFVFVCVSYVVVRLVLISPFQAYKQVIYYFVAFSFTGLSILCYALLFGLDFFEALQLVQRFLWCRIFELYMVDDLRNRYGFNFVGDHPYLMLFWNLFVLLICVDVFFVSYGLDRSLPYRTVIATLVMWPGFYDFLKLLHRCFTFFRFAVRMAFFTGVSCVVILYFYAKNVA
jgi:hypothetical protein